MLGFDGFGYLRGLSLRLSHWCRCDTEVIGFVCQRTCLRVCAGTAKCLSTAFPASSAVGYSSSGCCCACGGGQICRVRCNACLAVLTNLTRGARTLCKHRKPQQCPQAVYSNPCHISSPLLILYLFGTRPQLQQRTQTLETIFPLWFL